MPELAGKEHAVVAMSYISGFTRGVGMVLATNLFPVNGERLAPVTAHFIGVCSVYPAWGTYVVADRYKST